MTSRITLIAATTILSALWGAVPALAATSSEPSRPRTPGLGDPGQLVEVQVETGRTQNNSFTLDGQDARQQLVVTGKYSTGQLRDLTSKCTYETAPGAIISIDKSGLIVPQADGTA